MVTEVRDFQKQVIEGSHAKPVLVDFWAPWCGPCRVLGPVLEKLEGENGGAWTLAKVNTDENPQVSLEYRVSSIPAVKLFVDGNVVDEFLGALPEARVREWLGKALPNETRRNLDEAARLLDDGAVEPAKALLEQVVAEEPENGDARALLARAVVLDDSSRAIELIEGEYSYDPKLLPALEAVRTVARMFELPAQPERVPDEQGKPQYLNAIERLAGGDIDAGLVGFIGVVRTNRRLDDDGARRACLAILTLFGEHDARTREYRRALEQALF